MSVTGGKPHGVRVVSQAEIDNGTFRLAPGPAIKVAGIQAATRGVTAGPLTPVFVVDATYERGIEGGAALPVSNLSSGVRATTHDLAIPVYVVSDDGQFNGAGPVPAVLRLTWDDNSADEDGFSIERSTNGVDYAEIDTVAADVVTYDDNVMTQATYYYRVRAFNAIGDSDYSNVDSITI